MGTPEIKESLDDWISDYSSLDDIDKYLGKWKRLSKVKDTEKRENRIFINTELNKKVLVIDDEIKGWLANGDYAFYLYFRSDDHFADLYNCYVVITDLSYFKSRKVMSDWHLSEILNLPEYLDEMSETDFGSNKSIEDTRKDLIEYGLVEDKDVNLFMHGRC